MKYSPKIYAGGLLSAMEEKKPSSGMVSNFLNILRRNGDFYKLPEVLREAEILMRKTQKITKIEVVGARSFGSGFKQKLTDRFGPKADISFSIKPELIGGVVIKLDDETVIDASVKRRLDKLFF